MKLLGRKKKLGDSFKNYATEKEYAFEENT